MFLHQSRTSLSKRDTAFDGNPLANQNGFHIQVTTSTRDPSDASWRNDSQRKSLFFSAISLLSLPKASINMPICGRPETHMRRPCCQAHGQVISIHPTTSCRMCSIIPRRASHSAVCLTHAAVRWVFLRFCTQWPSVAGLRGVWLLTRLPSTLLTGQAAKVGDPLGHISGHKQHSHTVDRVATWFGNTVLVPSWNPLSPSEWPYFSLVKSRSVVGNSLRGFCDWFWRPK